MVRRIAASGPFSRSARLREMLQYLSGKVLDEQIFDVHELEVGHQVFGRPEHYDTTADNIVRVHASLLRKRLAEYFRTEGRDEELVIEIPRGNYAPVFRPRIAAAPGPEAADAPDRDRSFAIEQSPAFAEAAAPDNSKTRSRRWIYAVCLAVATFVALSVVLIRFHTPPDARSIVVRSTVNQLPPLWSELFSPSAPTQVVLDDASLDLYQQATGRAVTLNEYYDRSYLNSVEKSAANAHLDPHVVHSFLLRRQSDFAGANLVGRLAALAQQLGGTANVQFARDFSFHQLKSGEVILLGSAGSNPWIQPFENSLTVHWLYAPELDSYYPVDTAVGPAGANQFRPGPQGTRERESYATVAFLPNLGGTGNVLILSATGGTAAAAALAFTTDPTAMAQLASRLPQARGEPHFEALLRVTKGAGPRNVQLLLLRSPRTADVTAGGLL